MEKEAAPYSCPSHCWFVVVSCFFSFFSPSIFRAEPNEPTRRSCVLVAGFVYMMIVLPSICVLFQASICPVVQFVCQICQIVENLSSLRVFSSVISVASGGLILESIRVPFPSVLLWLDLSSYFLPRSLDLLQSSDNIYNLNSRALVRKLNLLAAFS